MGRVTERRRTLRIRDGAVSSRADTLVAEEPLEIRLNGKPLAITMRTPGDDFALAAGFLVSEGVIAEGDEVQSIVYCAGATADGVNTYNVVDVKLAPGSWSPTSRWSGTSTPPPPAACAARPAWTRCAPPPGTRSATLPGTRDARAALRPPGPAAGSAEGVRPDRGLHAAALFSEEGELLDVREDVGRHNAVDKLVGRALTDGRLPLSRAVLLVSGRASFELAQKAVMAGIPVLAAVSAPSSLAVDLAAESGLTLVGFLRGPSMNVYAGEHRIALESGVH
ncbi:sulfurtransferase FdhD [Streptomyces microflavus]|uniref:Sulfur carrier protein FdhD n=1 Tax=Streptomyces microflavus TaxID=1919 RepID=A0A7J0D1A8_STRMI|nr:sulfurtransferase FdhD [Streptomyces microflavus]